MKTGDSWSCFPPVERSVKSIWRLRHSISALWPRFSGPATENSTGSRLPTVILMRRSFFNYSNRLWTMWRELLRRSCPFIGLFGTVWGIMTSFRAIGMKGSASLGVVAPGIAEALIATAAGLAAAIPAVVAFNYFNRRARACQVEMGNFISDFTSMLERGLMRRAKT